MREITYYRLMSRKFWCVFCTCCCVVSIPVVLYKGLHLPPSAECGLWFGLLFLVLCRSQFCNVEFKERVELHLLLSLWASVDCSGVRFIFYLTCYPVLPHIAFFWPEFPNCTFPTRYGFCQPVSWHFTHIVHFIYVRIHTLKPRDLHILSWQM